MKLYCKAMGGTFLMLLLKLYETNEVHPSTLKNNFLFIFQQCNYCSVVNWCFVIIVEGSIWVHTRMGMEEKLAKMKTSCLDSIHIMIYFAKIKLKIYIHLPFHFFVKKKIQNCHFQCKQIAKQINIFFLHI